MASREQVQQLLTDVGRVGANILYPKEFEYYLVALELVDSKERVTDYFVFPVMPEMMVKKSDSLCKTKKTFGGVISLDTDQFIPIDFSIKGSFGRKLRFIVNKQEVNTTGINTSFNAGQFSTEIKTGYGSSKILEDLIKKSSTLDQYNKPYKLNFYNPSFGEAFVIKVKSYTYRQDYSSNMIWNYDLSIVALAELNQFKNARLKYLTFNLIVDGINSTLSTISTLLR